MAEFDKQLRSLPALLVDLANTEVRAGNARLGKFSHLLLGRRMRSIHWTVATTENGLHHVVPIRSLSPGQTLGRLLDERIESFQDSRPNIEVRLSKLTEALLRLDVFTETSNELQIHDLLRKRMKTYETQLELSAEQSTIVQLRSLIDDRAAQGRSSLPVPILLPDGQVNVRALEDTQSLVRAQFTDHQANPAPAALDRWKSVRRGTDLLQFLRDAEPDEGTSLAQVSSGHGHESPSPTPPPLLLSPRWSPLPDDPTRTDIARTLAQMGMDPADAWKASGHSGSGAPGDRGPGDGGPGDGGPDDGGPAGRGDSSRGQSRILVAEPPGSVAIETRFSIEVYITTDATSAAHQAPLTGCLPADTTVTINATVPAAFAVEGALTQDVRIPIQGESERRLFTMTAVEVGSHEIRFTAYAEGSFLGKLTVKLAVATDTSEATGAIAPTEQAMAWHLTPGEASLQIDYDESSKTFDFLFFGLNGYRARKPSPPMAVDIATRIGALLPELDSYARNDSGLTPEAAADNMRDQGYDLWDNLVPDEIRAAILDQREEITQLTVYCDREVVPWELLFAQDADGEDLGFLVDLFPVNRWVMGDRWGPRLSLANPTFVLPQDPPTSATNEITAIAATLAAHGPSANIETYRHLREALKHPSFGTLHFACHNYYSAQQGSQIVFADQIFVPKNLTRLTKRPLAPGHTLVFLNMCRSEGEIPVYTSFETWAQRFLQLGAAAVIGTSWAVRDTTASEFAQLVYRELADGKTLGEAVKAGRKQASATLGDPTWLAYTVYGDPNAIADLQETG